MNFETVVGLEVHVEFKTDTKIIFPSSCTFRCRTKHEHSCNRLGLSGSISGDE